MSDIFRRTQISLLHLLYVRAVFLKHTTRPFLCFVQVHNIPLFILLIGFYILTKTKLDVIDKNPINFI